MEGDEFCIFGKLIASQLRKLPSYNALLCQEKIQTIISKERLQLLQYDTGYCESRSTSTASSNLVEELEVTNGNMLMGFSRSRAELAISKTKAEDVEQAMEWLLANEEPAAQPVTESTAAPENIEEKVNIQPQEKMVAKSFKCDECGDLFMSTWEVGFHSMKSGHSKFSKSTEEKRQLAKIEAELGQRCLECEAREKVEELEREKGRIRSGKGMLEAKRKHEEAEFKKILDQKNRERQEARERVRQQIEKDKVARMALSDKKSDQPTVPGPAPSVTLVTNYSQVKLCIRLTNGNTLTQTFGTEEPLLAVRVFIEMNRTDEVGPFQLYFAFPPRILSNEDYNKPLKMLISAPAAVLVVSKT